jgi:hypothetical protein
VSFTLYRLVLFTKLAAVLMFAGGLLSSSFATSLAERRRAVHTVASPALLAVWVTGLMLSQSLGIGLGELWVVGGLGGSFVSLAALVVGLHVARRRVADLVAGAALVGVLGLMVFRPTWGGLR